MDGLLFGRRADTVDSSDIQAQVIQLYRLRFSFHLRRLDTDAWGLRVTLPVSLSSLPMEGVSSIGGFVRKLAVAAVVPGVELELPVGTRTLVRPFGKVGVGRSRGESATEVMYGAGVRVRTFQDVRNLHMTYGGSAAGRKTPALAGTSERYASFEAGIDGQLPLGFSVRNRTARGGIYAVARAFNGLELPGEGQAPIALRRLLEAGVSFSTEPDLRVWKIRLPWLAAGYVFGRTVSGVRFYTVFPF